MKIGVNRFHEYWIGKPLLQTAGLGKAEYSFDPAITGLAFCTQASFSSQDTPAKQSFGQIIRRADSFDHEKGP
jgi:hypothetical protein